MLRIACPLLVAYSGGSLLSASPGDSEAVFRTDVSLVRIDAQVVDGSNRVIPDLKVDDFVLREDGHIQPIRQFASEGVPLDVLLLLDVSASMGPHVQRIAQASRQALTVLDQSDRMGIMVFDRFTRLRLPLSDSRQGWRSEIDRLLWEERFNGGTDITRAMLVAAGYMQREGRRDVRRAIIILTDDQTQLDRNEGAVSTALAAANTVMCALIAPDALRFGRNPPGVGLRRGRLGNPGGGPGGYWATTHTQSAGTAEIAHSSGGEAMPVEQASSLQETLRRLRQRFTLFFNLPEGVKPGEERAIEVALADTLLSRFPGATVHYRRVYMTPNNDAGREVP
jgi:VWFA-related protein